MRFSVWPGSHRPWDEVLSTALTAEREGWDGLWFADHFMPNTPSGDGPTLEVWAVLAALAHATDRLRLGPLVTSVTYRHPAVVANAAAAVDVISGGRLVLGLGAGWQANEHAAYGLELGDVPTRSDRLEEAAGIIRSLLRDDRTTVDGRFFTITDAPNEPKPVQPRLPLLVAGKGERRTAIFVGFSEDAQRLVLDRRSGRGGGRRLVGLALLRSRIFARVEPAPVRTDVADRLDPVARLQRHVLDPPEQVRRGEGLSEELMDARVARALDR